MTLKMTFLSSKHFIGRKIMAYQLSFWYNKGMFETKSEDELLQLGQSIGEKLEAGHILVLTGELGAGKTTLTKGIGKGLAIKQMIKSPTYTIVREYQGRLPLYHLDVYRLGTDPDSIDLDDFLYGDGVVIIEWGHLLGEVLPDDYLEVIIDKIPEGRRTSLSATGRRSHLLKEKIQNG